jgi:hypothetical protein
LQERQGGTQWPVRLAECKAHNSFLPVTASHLLSAAAAAAACRKDKEALDGLDIIFTQLELQLAEARSVYTPFQAEAIVYDTTASLARGMPQCATRHHV